jgi:hypothetical protein
LLSEHYETGKYARGRSLHRRRDEELMTDVVDYCFDFLMELCSPHGAEIMDDLKRRDELPEELSLKVGDGGNREGGISWGCLTPPLLHQRSDMPCPKITSSS